MTIITLSLSPTPTSSLPLFPPKPLSATATATSTATTTTDAATPTSTPKSLAISRRIAALCPLITTAASPAFAFDFRISGPKDWLKEQKKKSVKYLLAPIVASRDILSYARQLLLSKDSSFEQKDMDEIKGMLNSAARDCVAEDRNSLVAFQARTGVEVCTFKLVVSNASSLLDDNDPTKLEAETRLNDLIRSFTFLNGLAKEADVQLVSNREKVADALTDTLSTLDKFEQGIMGCIEA